MSNEKFKPPYKVNKSLSAELVWMNNSKIRLEFKGSCLKQEDKAVYTQKNVVSFFIVYQLDSWRPNFDTDFTLGGCLFGGVKLTENADPDKYSYCGFGIGFNICGEYSLPDGSVCKNVTIFGADMSSSVHIDNRGKDILILDKGPTKGLNNTLTAESQYLISFRRPGIKSCLSLHYNGSNSLLFVNATKICQFKGKDFEIKEMSFVFRKYFTRLEMAMAMILVLIILLLILVILSISINN